MSLIRIDRDPPASQLAVFAGLWGVFFGAAAWAAHRSGHAGLAAALVAAALGVPAAGLVRREALRRVYVAAAFAALPIGWVVSYAALVLIYYAILAPIGLAARLGGYDPMRRGFDRRAASYWLRRDGNPPAARYFRQF